LAWQGPGGLLDSLQTVGDVLGDAVAIAAGAPRGGPRKRITIKAGDIDDEEEDDEEEEEEACHLPTVVGSGLMPAGDGGPIDHGDPLYCDISWEQEESIKLSTTLFPHEIALYKERYRALKGKENAAVSRDMLLALFRVDHLAAAVVGGAAGEGTGDEGGGGEGGEAGGRARGGAAGEEAGGGCSSSGVLPAGEVLSSRIVTLMDTDEDGTISLYDYLSWVGKLVRGGTEERSKTAWDVYDIQARGAVSRRDMTTVLLELVELMAQANGTAADSLLPYIDI